MDVELTEYSHILIFLIGAAGFCAVGMFASKLLSVYKPNQEKNKSYESGEDPLEDARIQYNPGYFIIALIFLLFEVELVFLFPWALIFDNDSLQSATNGTWGWLTLTEMFIFIGILGLGLAFVWQKGYLDWPKPKAEKSKIHSVVPKSMYDAINIKYQKRS
jgi:NADH-quinone oxidoreductase subunit A